MLRTTRKRCGFACTIIGVAFLLVDSIYALNPLGSICCFLFGLIAWLAP